MINNNKILTVSYGTFSCTLEGFEDSFGTMKVIAEYFRDLAADDRYFGAEPPQPDAEMLARIAEKEVSRKVEAREQDGRIVLSALEQSAAPAAAAALAAAPELVAGTIDEVDQPEDADRQEAVSDVLTDDIESAELTSDVSGIVDAPEIVIEDPAEAVSLDAEDPTIGEDAAVAIEEVAEEEDSAPLDMVSTNDISEHIEDAPADVDIAEIDELEVAEEPLVQASESDVSALDDDTAEEPAADEGSIEVPAGSELDAIEAPGDVAAEAAPEDAAAVAFEEDENDIVPGQPDTEVEAFFAAADTATDTDIDAFEDDAADAALTPAPLADLSAIDAPEPDSIAAKLQRIREVVAQHDDQDDADDYLEDEHADAAVSNEIEEGAAHKMDVDPPAAEEEDSASVIADALADIEGAIAEDEVADDKADEAVAEDATASEEATAEDAADAIAAQSHDDDEDDLTAILERLGDDSAEQHDRTVLDDVSLDDAAKEAAQDPSVEDTVNNLFESDDTAIEDTPEVTETATDQGADPAGAPVVKATPSRARVIKVKRADLEAAIQKGDLEEYEDTAASGEDDDVAAAISAATSTSRDRPGLDDLAPAKSDKTALSKDDEEDLARELAELEQDIAQESGQAKRDAPEQEQPAATARHNLPSIDDEDASSDVNRLLAETDQQMDEPESATRRDAFAHLRAAVAAKKADDTMDGDASKRDSDDAYREDLAEVVRPRRPVSVPRRTERPSEPRPAPLKLVAEQRVNTDDQPDKGPVKPRRIAATADGPQAGDDGESFADFAADMGATTLPQLLEAAAAYMSFVEGREQFSRPQLMTKVRQSGVQDGFSREDGLRSFGQLLRAGKIEKLKGGRFTVSEDIGYRPDHRAAG